jgi:hypothetical protein
MSVIVIPAVVTLIFYLNFFALYSLLFTNMDPQRILGNIIHRPLTVGVFLWLFYLLIPRYRKLLMLFCIIAFAGVNTADLVGQIRFYSEVESSKFYYNLIQSFLVFMVLAYGLIWITRKTVLDNRIKQHSAKQI